MDIYFDYVRKTFGLTAVPCSCHCDCGLDWAWVQEKDGREIMVGCVVCTDLTKEKHVGRR